MTVTCEMFSCKQYSNKIPNKLNKHGHFGLSSCDPSNAKRPTSFPKIYCQSSYMLVMVSPIELLYGTVVPILDEEQS